MPYALEREYKLIVWAYLLEGSEPGEKCVFTTIDEVFVCLVADVVDAVVSTQLIHMPSVIACA